jgi:hypothetical protein
LRGGPDVLYKLAMAETTTFPRRLILAGAMISGLLLALAVHMLGQRFGLDLGGLWRNDPRQLHADRLGHSLVADRRNGLRRRLRHGEPDAQRGIRPHPAADAAVLIGIGVLVLAGAGQAASAPKCRSDHARAFWPDWLPSALAASWRSAAATSRSAKPRLLEGPERKAAQAFARAAFCLLLVIATS